MRPDQQLAAEGPTFDVNTRTGVVLIYAAWEAQTWFEQGGEQQQSLLMARAGACCPRLQSHPPSSHTCNLPFILISLIACSALHTWAFVADLCKKLYPSEHDQGRHTSQRCSVWALCRAASKVPGVMMSLGAANRPAKPWDSACLPELVGPSSAISALQESRACSAS